MHRLLAPLALVLLFGCPADDDDFATDDDDTVVDDDDSGPDDDDSVAPDDDDSVVPDDDDSGPDDDDVAPDDDDSVVPDDDDVAPDDDDSVVPDDDDVAPDDDDSVVPDDDDVAPDDDDSVVPDDDDTVVMDDDDTVVVDDDDTVVVDDDDTVVVDDDDTVVVDDDDTVVVDDDDTVVVDDDDSAAPECFDDFYEDNDSASNPWILFPNTYPGLTVCEFDEDWFAITLFPGEDITVDLGFDHAEGDVDAELYDYLGTLVAEGISSTDDETLGPVNTATGGMFMLVVWLVSDAGVTPGNDYDLSLSVGLPICVDDPYENNDSSATAWSVSPGSYSGLTTCDYDDDWFEIELFPNEEITVDLTFIDAEGNINAELYDPLGTLVADAITVTDDESLGPVASASGGTYQLAVWLASDAGVMPGNDYNMTIGVSAATCTDDIFEDNDSISNPFSLTPTGYSGMRVCPTDEDWFSVLLDAGDELEVDLLFSDAEGDIDLDVYDPAGTWLDSSTSYDDDEYVSIIAASAGQHLVQVTLPIDDGTYLGNMYTMLLTVTEPPPTCPQDLYEPNNSSGAVSWIPLGPTYGLNVCTDDEDWYYVWAMAGDSLAVDVYFYDSEGNIDLELYDPYLALVDWSYSSGDDEDVGPVTISSTGNQYIRVELYTDDGAVPGNDYDIYVDLVY